MAGLTKQFIHTLGIEMGDDEFNIFSEYFSDTLRSRVINDIVLTMDNEQVLQLSIMRDAGDDAVWFWLHSNVPNLNDIIYKEVTTIIGEMATNREYL